MTEAILLVLTPRLHQYVFARIACEHASFDCSSLLPIFGQDCPYERAVNTASSCLAQGNHWVHLGRAPGWKVAG